jgi:hypothetical protein
MAQFSTIYNEIQQIYSDPKSYEKKEEKRESSRQEIIHNFYQFVSQCSDITNESGFDNIKTNLNTILNTLLSASGIKFDYTNLVDYIKYLKNKDEKNTCTHFVDNSDIIAKYDKTESDDKPIPIEMFFKSMECKSCGFFKENHKCCSKYSFKEYKQFSSEGCLTCGLERYEHIVCDNYSGKTDKECDKCGRDFLDHVFDSKKKGKTHCGNYEQNTDTQKSYIQCKNCIFSECDHMLNPILTKMNKNAYDKFTDLAFKFQTKFLTETDSQKIYYHDMFLSVMKMNYTTTHPMYSMFSEAIIPKIEEKIYPEQITLV